MVAGIKYYSSEPVRVAARATWRVLTISSEEDNVSQASRGRLSYT